MMLVQHSTKYVLPLTILASQQVTVTRARDVDFTFFQIIVGDHNTPEYGGFNTRLSREQGQFVQAATKAEYAPLTPSDPDTMITAMTNDTEQSFTIFTADQQLYRIIVDIRWVYPYLFTQFIPRPGGMHLLMSFVGSVGTLMANTGLEEIMKSAFGGVAKMLTVNMLAARYDIWTSKMANKKLRTTPYLKTYCFQQERLLVSMSMGLISK